MPPLTCRSRALRVPWILSLLLAAVASAGVAKAPTRKPFDLQTGPAAVSLPAFVSQSGVQLLYVAEEVSGVTTNRVVGEFTVVDAVRRLLADTPLRAVETESGAIAVNRSPDPNGQRVAQDSERDHPKLQSEPNRPTNPPAR